MPVIRFSMMMIAVLSASAMSFGADAQLSPAVHPVAGVSEPDAVGPARPGGGGAVRDAMTVQVRMTVPSACTITVSADNRVATRCTGAIPCRITITSDADPDFGSILAFQTPPPARRDLVRIQHQRLVVDF